MTDEMNCERVRELAPELALDIAGGEERDRALHHLATCPGCRGVVSDLSALGDELLLLAPAAEPPAGFSDRTLARLTDRSVAPVTERSVIRITERYPRRRRLVAT